MSNRLLFCWLIWVVALQKSTAQSREESRFFAPGLSCSFSGGYSFFTPPKKAPSLALPELPFPATGDAGRFFDLNYTFSNHWGVRILGGVVDGNPAWKQPVKILEKTFPGYFIEYSSTDYFHFSSNQVFIGSTYTRYHGRLFLQPTMMIGFSQISYRRAVARVKEMGTNRLYSLEFLPVKNAKWAYSPTLLTGTKLGCFFTRRCGIYISIDGTALRENIRYTYTQTEEIAKTVTTDIRSLIAWQYAISIQGGLSIFLH